MEQSLKPMIEQLEDLFSKFNSRFYDGKLQTPVITISPDTTKGAYGWCTGWKAWHSKKTPPNTDSNDGYYEINMCAEYLSRPFEETACTLLHEMAHLYNLEIGVQDTSRGGTYHNKKYKETAESHGLIVTKDSKYGYCRTTLNDEAKAFVEQFNHTVFSLYRKSAMKAKKEKKSSSSRKYVCPDCGCIIRATKEVHVICADCNIPFEEEL